MIMLWYFLMQLPAALYILKRATQAPALFQLWAEHFRHQYVRPHQVHAKVTQAAVHVLESYQHRLAAGDILQASGG